MCVIHLTARESHKENVFMVPSDVTKEIQVVSEAAVLCNTYLAFINLRPEIMGENRRKMVSLHYSLQSSSVIVKD